VVPVPVPVPVPEVGLVPIAPLQVADAGKRGGGIPPCLDTCDCGCDVGSSGFWGAFLVGCGGCEACVAAFDDARLQPPKLSLRLREEPDDGVSGSVEVVCAESDVSFFCIGRGPATVMFCISTSLPEDLDSALARGCWWAKSPLPFGNELDE
jgi:hypothetical protein